MLNPIETIIKDFGENHRALIPQGAMDHLQAVPADTAFVGSIFVAQTLVPTLFLKLSAKTAARIGLLPDEFYGPSYKFLTVEDQDGNTVSLVTLQDGEKRIMHAQLDPGDRQVQEFIRLAKQQECFFLDVTVAHKTKPYGTSELLISTGNTSTGLRATWYGPPTSRLPTTGRGWLMLTKVSKGGYPETSSSPSRVGATTSYTQPKVPLSSAGVMTTTSRTSIWR